MKAEIRNLITRLNGYRDAYYNGNTSPVSNAEYDELFDQLQSLEQESGIVFSDSPTQTVGYEVKSELNKVKHSCPMLSLDKTKEVKKLIHFISQKIGILSCKMDGLTILLTYKDGVLVQAETRGDGEIGEDVTHNARVFENIPIAIPKEGVFRIKGEAIITYNDFEKINSVLPEEKKYKNPRNLVSGSVRQLDSKIAKDRHIKFIVWEVPDVDNYYQNGFKLVSQMGFDVVPFIRVCNNTQEEIESYIESLKQKAEELGYPIDGLVLTFDDIKYGKYLGMTGHHPRHSIAYKFYDDEYETKLLNIEWTMGKTGVLTPTAVFEPVEIDGTMVERASLSNISVANDTLGTPYKGQTVYVSKRNMIIPKIERADKLTKDNFMDYADRHFVIPEICPICGEPTHFDYSTDVRVLYCSNENCSGKLLGKLCHFVSKNAMNIDGLSEATLQTLIDEFEVSCYSDLYVLKNYKDDIKRWKSMDGFGEKSVDKILEAIEKSRTTTLDRVLNAVCIPNVGKQTAKDIAKYCNYDIETFKKYMQTCSAFENINGIGGVVVESLFKWFNNEWIDFLELCRHLTFTNPNNNSNQISLSGMTFCITGSLNVFKNRDEAVAKIEELGGKVAGSVSKKTSYLVNNDSNSSSGKNKKAKELGIPIITEDELLSLINKQ